MPRKPDSNKFKVKLDRLAKKIEKLRLAAIGNAFSLPMVSMAAVLAAKEVEEARYTKTVRKMIAKAGNPGNYGQYLDGWKSLFFLAAPSLDSFLKQKRTQGETAVDASCRGIERAVMSFARYPMGLRNIHPPAQAWQIFVSCLSDWELRKLNGEAEPIKIDLLGGKAAAVAGTEELAAVWEGLVRYAIRMPSRGEMLKKMALLWRGGSLARLVLAFRLTSEEIAQKLDPLHNELKKYKSYSLSGKDKIFSKEDAIELLRLISQAYRFLAERESRGANSRLHRSQGPDTIGIALMAAGLAEEPTIKAAEEHIISCRQCVKDVIEMAAVTETIINSPTQQAEIKDERWQRIEAFINLWNGKQAVLRFGTLVLTVDRVPEAAGVSAILRSENKQSFVIKTDENNMVEAIYGEVRVPVMAEVVTIKIMKGKTAVGGVDLPGK